MTAPDPSAPIPSHQRLYILAIALLTLGLGAGFLPVLSSHDTKCGAAFYATEPSEIDQEIAQQRSLNSIPAAANDCDGVRSTAQAIALVLLAAGAAAGAAGWAAAGRRTQS